MARILVVDDERPLLETVGRILEKNGHVVKGATTALEAASFIDKEEFDLVLLDLKLPDASGFELLEKLIAKDLTVVVMSAYGGVEGAVKAVKAGAYDYIEKPFGMERLLITVEKALESSRRKQQMQAMVELEDELIGESEAMLDVKEKIEMASRSDSRVLIYGENGTGKELVARSIHLNSGRKYGPFIKLNCAAIPHDLVEAELFGFEKGAFTGAVRSKPGKFELADGGTLFLDEIGDMPLPVQAKVLRVIQEQEFERIGGTRSIRVNVRIIAATNKNISEMIKRGEFREDLFYRLNVIPIYVPPLRERRQDIPLIVNYFLDKFSGGRKKLTDGAMKMLISYDWPGNVRELKNIVERLVVMTVGDLITEDDVRGAFGMDFHSKREMPPELPFKIQGVDLKTAKELLEKYLIEQKLKECRGNVSKAAKELGLDRTHLYRKIKKYGLEVSEGES